MTVEDEINKIENELDLGEIDTILVSDVVPKPKEFGEPSIKKYLFHKT